MADIFVNDAFGTAHRAHASTAGVADYLPAVCGYLVQKEVSIMGKALADPERPFVAILGGAKVSDKLNVINNLLEKVDTLIIGGGMAYTFVAAKGYGIGKSLFDAEKVDYCKDMMKKAEEKGVKLLLPIDTVVAADFPNPIDAPVDVETVDVTAIPADKEGLDIGEKDPRAVCRCHQEREDRCLERAHGRVREPDAGQGHHCRGTGTGGFRRCDHRRRRRLCGGLRAAGLCGQDHAYFHRRRCIA